MLAWKKLTLQKDFGVAGDQRSEPLLPHDPDTSSETPSKTSSCLKALASQVASIKDWTSRRSAEDDNLCGTTEGERTYLLLLFLIGSIYTYGPLMSYPLYKGLVRVRGETEVSPVIVATCLVLAKVASQVLHYLLYSLAMRRPAAGLRSLQALVAFMYIVSALGLVAAAHPRTSSLGVLVGICCLNLVSSKTLGGALFAAPRECMFKTRAFAYEVGGVAGCLWTALVLALLQSAYAKDSNLFMYSALVLPLVPSLAFWFLLSPGKFFNASRLLAAQNSRVSSCEEKSPSVREEIGRPKGVEEDWDVERFQAIVEDDGLSSSSTTAPRSPRSDASADASSDQDAKDDPTILTLCDTVDAQYESLNAAIRRRRFVLCSAQCVLWWCFNFYAYTVFPVLIAKVGPSLETVSSLYTLEGSIYTAAMVALLPRLRKHFNVLYFGSCVMVALLPVLSICVLGRVHWSGYLIGLWCSDMCCCIMNSIFGLVCLRCLPWETLPGFYSATCTIGGLICALSNVQMALYEHIGWRLTVIVGHGVPMCFLALVYFTWYAETMADIWYRLAPAEADPRAS